MEKLKVVKKIKWDEVKKAIQESSNESSIYVGCDSQHRKKSTLFGLVVVIHIDSSKGGRVFYEISKAKRIKSLRERLLKEVELAVTGALQIVESVGNRPFVIHLDINRDPAHKSSVIVNEAIGWVTAQNLEVAVKPEAWASAHVADHICRL